jgi:2-oxoglutarate dehydrogenase E2 component (dihydrolipoamide succinyltransferase)
MIDVVMPQMGESIVEGTLTKWLKKPGDHVERDEPLFEISTDKVDTEIPAPSAGTLAEIIIEEGKTVGINTVVGRISDGDGAAPAQSAPAQSAPAQSTPAAAPPATPAAPPAPPAAPAAEEPPQPKPAAEPPAPSVAAPPAQAEETAGPLSPLVRKMAREHNIDLSKVKGTGAGGRITKQDLDAHLASRSTPPQPPAAEAATPAPVQAPPAREAPVPMPGEAPSVRVEPMSVMRQKIAEHMVFSKRTSAHVTTVHKTDMTRIARLRARLKDEFQVRYGFGLTFLPFVIRAATAGLREYPIVNASIEGTNIIYHRDINIGVAVALENGLIVPVIRNADEKNVVGLQRSVVDLATRARSRRLRPDEVQAGTFSITNFGSFGSLFATPVINQPQVAILGLGAVVKEPVVVDDAIAIRSTAYLALTFDHRLIDGALADQFTAKVKSVLESWNEEIL